MSAEQLSLFSGDTVLLGTDGQGYIVLTTPRGGWRARLVLPWGWVFYRALGDEWESYEPPLPPGQTHVTDRTEAEEWLLMFADRYGDDPWWMTARRKHLTLVGGAK